MARTRSRPWFDPRRWFRSSASFVERITGRVRRRAVLARMKKGDIVLASPRLVRLSPIALAYRLLLGSRYVHSMLYVGSDRMIHTTTRHGVVMGRIPRKLFDRERYAIYRAPGLTDASIRWRWPPTSPRAGSGCANPSRGSRRTACGAAS